jgi:hypothetical protein
MDFARDFYFETDDERKQVWHIAMIAKEILETEYSATGDECEIIEAMQIIEINDGYREEETYPDDEQIKRDIRAQIDCFDDYPSEEMIRRYHEENPDSVTTWEDLTEEEKQEWSYDFMDLAREQIEGYDADEDAESPAPWCAPWYSEGYEEHFRTPEAYLDEVREELSEICEKEFIMKEELKED